MATISSLSEIEQGMCCYELTDLSASYTELLREGIVTRTNPRILRNILEKAIFFHGVASDIFQKHYQGQTSEGMIQEKAVLEAIATELGFLSQDIPEKPQWNFPENPCLN